MCVACKKDEWSSQGATSCQKCPCTQTTGDKPGTKKEDCKPRTPNPKNNKCSEEATATNEGFCPRCYLDTKNIPTIGYGLNLNNADAGDVLKKYGLLLKDVKEDCTSKLCLDLQTTPPKRRAAGESDMPPQHHGETIHKAHVVERRQKKSPPPKPVTKLCLGKDSIGCKYCEKYPKRCLQKADGFKLFDEDYVKDKMRSAKKFAPDQPEIVLAALADMAMGGTKKFNQPPPSMQAIKKSIDSCAYSAAADGISKLGWCAGVGPDRCGKVVDCIRHVY